MSANLDVARGTRLQNACPDLSHSIFRLMSWVHPWSRLWQAGPTPSGACSDNRVFPHCPSRRLSRPRSSTESAMPRLPVVRAWSGPAKLPLGIMSFDKPFSEPTLFRIASA